MKKFPIPIGMAAEVAEQPKDQSYAGMSDKRTADLDGTATGT